MPNKYKVEKVFIYLGLGILASIFFISLLNFGVYFVEERISNMPEIDQMAENSEKISSEIQRYKEILEKSGIQNSDIMKIKLLDENLNKSLAGVHSLMNMLVSSKENLALTTDRITYSTQEIGDAFESLSARQLQMEIAYGDLEESVNRIVSLESENFMLNATLAHQRSLLLKILALSEGENGLKLTDDMKRDIAVIADDNQQLQIGGPPED